MIYSKDQLPEIFSKIDDLITGSKFQVYKKPAPIYISGPNWTDELREKNGYTLIDGEWFQVVPVQVYWDSFKNDVEKLMDDISKQCYKADKQQQMLYEMEYGLRVAEQTLKNSLKLKQDLQDGI